MDPAVIRPTGARRYGEAVVWGFFAVAAVLAAIFSDDGPLRIAILAGAPVALWVAWRASRQHVLCWSDRLCVVGSGPSKTIYRHDVTGFRSGKSGLTLETSDGRWFAPTVPDYVRESPCFLAWRLPDLDRRDARDEARRRLADTTLGATQAERRAKRRLFARIGWLARGASVAVLLGAYYVFSDIRFALGVTVGVMPPLALLLRGALRLIYRIDPQGDDPRPAFPLAMLGAPPLFWTFAQNDLTVIDWQAPSAWAALLALAAAVALRDPEDRKGEQLRSAVFVFIWALMYFYAAIVELDKITDIAPPAITRATVIDRYETGSGKSRTEYLVVGPGKALEVRGDVYEATRVGDKLCIFDHRGGLHLRWRDIARCSGPGRK